MLLMKALKYFSKQNYNSRKQTSSLLFFGDKYNVLRTN